MNYLMGDLQGCHGALQRMLELSAFSPSRDHLLALGDLVNRGPASLQVLQTLHGLGSAATCLLGNHDLHFMALALGARPPHRGDTLAALLEPGPRETWLEWMRQRPLAALQDGWLCVHAGVPPQWSTADTLTHATALSQVLRGPGLADFMHTMYGNEPLHWSDELQGAQRYRFITNALTRLRFCTPDGVLDLVTKDGAGAAPSGHLPWFDCPNRRTAGQPMAFGHWSTLGLINRPDLLALDTGCVWGGKLSMVRVDGGRRDLLQVDCGAEGVAPISAA